MAIELTIVDLFMPFKLADVTTPEGKPLYVPSTRLHSIQEKYILAMLPWHKPQDVISHGDGVSLIVDGSQFSRITALNFTKDELQKRLIDDGINFIGVQAETRKSYFRSGPPLEIDINLAAVLTVNPAPILKLFSSNKKSILQLRDGTTFTVREPADALRKRIAAAGPQVA